MKLLTTKNAKTVKGEPLGYLTGILYLAPHTQAASALKKKVNVCPWASKGCAKACLFTAGRGQMHMVRAARLRKTKWFFTDRPGFLKQLREDIAALARRAERAGLKPCVRLNGTSDIGWENMGIMEQFPDVQFYGYTKSLARVLAAKQPNDYNVFSLSETNAESAWLALTAGVNVACVVALGKHEAAPKRVTLALAGMRHTFPVVDGDKHDLRFIDTPKYGAIVILRAKGKAKKDTTGFAGPISELFKNLPAVCAPPKSKRKVTA